ncbi:MAG: ABC transporter substrate-binding protein [Chloroflexota bacterium]
MKTKRNLRRRDFLKLTAAVASVGLLNACSATAQPTATTAPPQPTTKPAAQAPASPTAAPPTAAPAATKAPSPTPTLAGPKKGGTLTLALTAGVIQFHPMQTVPGNMNFIRAIYNALLHYGDQLKPEPELAEKWDFSADGLAMTLTLRQGVKFHSGREFTSDDVKATVEFAQTDENSTQAPQYKTIKAVETPGKYTAVLKFATVNPGIFDLLDTLFIIDKETIADRAKRGIGTGPLKMDKYLPNDRVELSAFPDYWEKGKPYLDKYIIRQIPDQASLSVNLESGAVDYISRLNYYDIVRLKNTGKFTIDMGAPGRSIMDIALNCKTPPLDNKKVRQAIAWSIDRQRYCDTALQGLSKPTCLIWPSISWAYFPDLQGKIGFDLDKAKALLKEAGFENGFETEILTSSKRAFGYGELAQVLQSDLKKIGVNAKIADVEPAVYQSRNTRREHSIVVHAYGKGNRDPGSALTGAVAWYNDKNGGLSRFESATYDQLVKDLNATLDQEKRQATCRKIQELALDECFTLPVAPVDEGMAYGKYVKGVHHTLHNIPYVADIWLDK